MQQYFRAQIKMAQYFVQARHVVGQRIIVSVVSIGKIVNGKRKSNRHMVRLECHVQLHSERKRRSAGLRIFRKHKSCIADDEAYAQILFTMNENTANVKQ